MWREILRIINEATVDGLSKGKVPVHEDDFLSALRHSNEVFAAMKTHQMGEDMAKKLLDGNGKLKPFKQWRDDVSDIARHHVGAWLKTEYNTAVIRAHAAADWREFERNKDILPNLRWMPTTSAEPDSAHKAYWQMKLTLPVDDPFWDEHHPGDRWNCKCSLEATDDPEVRPKDLEYTKPQRGLESNPGKTAEMFSNTHPYYPNSCNSCPFNKGFKNKAKSFFRNEKKHCNECRKIDLVIPTTKENAKKLSPEQKHQIYSLPIGQQFKEVEKNVFRHVLKTTDEEDYNRLLDVAKAYAKEGSKVWILPEVHKSETTFRAQIGFTSNTKTPDLRINDGLFVDVKSPENYRKITKNANKAYEQGGIACISNHFITLKTSNLGGLTKSVYSQGVYRADEIHYYIDGTLYKYNSQGELLD